MRGATMQPDLVASHHDGRRRRRHLALCGVLAVALALASPDLPGAVAQGPGDRAFGSGDLDLSGFDAHQSFSFDARSGPLGENPTGTFRFDFSGPDIGEGSVAGTVTCLQ